MGAVDTKRREESRARRVCLAWVEALDVPLRGIARTVDLSSRGLGLVLPRGLALGTRIRVQIQLDGDACLLGEGVVVHTTPLEDGQHRIGLELVRQLDISAPPGHCVKVI